MGVDSSGQEPIPSLPVIRLAVLRLAGLRTALEGLFLACLMIAFLSLLERLRGWPSQEPLIGALRAVLNVAISTVPLTFLESGARARRSSLRRAFALAWLVTVSAFVLSNASWRYASMILGGRGPLAALEAALDSVGDEALPLKWAAIWALPAALLILFRLRRWPIRRVLVVLFPLGMGLNLVHEIDSDLLFKGSQFLWLHQGYTPLTILSGGLFSSATALAWHWADVLDRLWGGGLAEEEAREAESEAP